MTRKRKMTKKEAERTLDEKLFEIFRNYCFLTFCSCSETKAGQCSYCIALSRIRAGENARKVVEDYL